MKFRDLLEKKKVIFFDGAMGTSLQPYLSHNTPPEILNLTLPEKVKEVHLSYINQGVDVIETNTFGGNRIKLEKYGEDKNLREINYQAVKIAKEVSSSNLVGASIGPLGELIQPWGKISANEALEVFREQIEVLVEAGSDLIVIETMMSLKEAKIAVIAARQVCDLPVVCQLTFNENGKTLIGNTPQTVVSALEMLDVDAIGANCGTGPEEMLQVVRIMNSYSNKPLIFQPNAGKPYLNHGKTSFSVTPEKFAQGIKQFVQNGARIVGGCCGTNFSHIAAMIREVKGLFPPYKKPIKLK